MLGSTLALAKIYGWRQKQRDNSVKKEAFFLSSTGICLLTYRLEVFGSLPNVRQFQIKMAQFGPSRQRRPAKDEEARRVAAEVAEPH